MSNHELKLCRKDGALHCKCNRHQWKIQKLLNRKEYFMPVLRLLNITMSDDYFLKHFYDIIEQWYKLRSKINQPPSLNFDDSDLRPIEMVYTVFKYDENNLLLTSPQKCQHNNFPEKFDFQRKIMELIHFEPGQTKHVNLNKHKFNQYFGLNGCCKQCAMSFAAIIGFCSIEFMMFDDKSMTLVYMDRLILFATWIANGLLHHQFVKYVSTAKRVWSILYILHRLTFCALKFHETNKSLYLKRRQLICLAINRLSFIFVRNYSHFMKYINRKKSCVDNEQFAEIISNLCYWVKEELLLIYNLKEQHYVDYDHLSALMILICVSPKDLWHSLRQITSQFPLHNIKDLHHVFTKPQHAGMNTWGFLHFNLLHNPIEMKKFFLRFIQNQRIKHKEASECQWINCKKRKYDQLKRKRKWYKCKACGVVEYCSRSCQKKDWSLGDHCTGCRCFLEAEGVSPRW